MHIRRIQNLESSTALFGGRRFALQMYLDREPERAIGAVGRRRYAGFTIIEVLIAVLIVSFMFGGIIYAYIGSNDRAEWSAYSLAAESLAMQGIEQARAAKWDPQAWPVVDDLGVTNYTRVEKLDVPVSGGGVYATNYISISTISTSPQIRQLRADCVWALVSRHHGASGPFTNTAVTLRASDQ